MSMNIHISAERIVIVKKTGQESSQRVYFDCFQTPTDITYQILDTTDPIKAYKEWILSETFNSGKLHVQELEEWIDSNEAVGYEIDIFAM